MIDVYSDEPELDGPWRVERFSEASDNLLSFKRNPTQVVPQKPQKQDV